MGIRSHFFGSEVVERTTYLLQASSWGPKDKSTKKSGSDFWFSKCNKFIIKSMQAGDESALIDGRSHGNLLFREEYPQRLKRDRGSFLVRILFVFKRGTQYYYIMNNWHSIEPKHAIEEFDIKHSGEKNKIQ